MVKPGFALSVLLIFLLSWAAHAQQIVKDANFFKNLLLDSAEITDIATNNKLLPKTDYLQFDDMPYPPQIINFVKHQGNLLMLPDGTGRVYQMNSTENKIEFQRLDSTIFFGYNFSSYPFSYQDTLYSFGGSGFWRLNGHLRFYRPDKKEWELIRLEKEVISKEIIFNKHTGKLYLFNDSIYTLDLSSKKIINLGRRFQQAAASEKNIFSTSPWGIILGFANNYYLVDIERNEISLLNRRMTGQINANFQNEIKYYVKDSTICFNSKFNSDKLSTVTLSKKDFILTEDKFYEEIKTPGTWASIGTTITKHSWFILSFISGLVLGLVLTYYYRDSKKNKPASANISAGMNLDTLFTREEKDLIALVYSNSVNELPTSAESINQALGVSVKSMDIQKKHRSDTLLTINKKYSIVSGNNEHLIISKRNAQDKRTFDYYIDQRYFVNISHLLK
jgi:hypothetical protein